MALVINVLPLLTPDCWCPLNRLIQVEILMSVQKVVINTIVVRNAHVEVSRILPAEAEGPPHVAVYGDEDRHSYRPAVRTNVGCLLIPVGDDCQGPTAHKIISLRLAGMVYLGDAIRVSQSFTCTEDLLARLSLELLSRWFLVCSRSIADTH